MRKLALQHTALNSAAMHCTQCFLCGWVAVLELLCGSGRQGGGVLWKSQGCWRLMGCYVVGGGLLVSSWVAGLGHALFQGAWVV